MFRRFVFLFVLIGLVSLARVSCRGSAPGELSPHRPARDLGREPSAFDARRMAAELDGPRSYREAKRILPELFPGPARTFYCECVYDVARAVDPAACGLPEELGSAERRVRLEWEHVVPAATFGRSFPEWGGHPDCKKRRGRRCVRRTSEAFNRMEGDLFNIRPAVGAVNQVRGSRAMAEIPGDHSLGACHFELDGGRAEPRDAVKGDVARIYLYMEETYPGRGIIDPRDLATYERWSRDDPVDAEECGLGRRIAEVMGRQNPVLDRECRIAGL